MISYEDFKKVEIIKIGKIISAEKIPDTDKLLLLKVDFGTATLIVSIQLKLQPRRHCPTKKKRKEGMSGK